MLPAAGIALARASSASASEVLPDPARPTSARVLIRLMVNLDRPPPPVLVPAPAFTLPLDQSRQQLIYLFRRLQLREVADPGDEFDLRLRRVAAHHLQPGRSLALLDRDALALGVKIGALDHQQRDFYGGWGGRPGFSAPRVPRRRTAAA